MHDKNSVTYDKGEDNAHENAKSLQYHFDHFVCKHQQGAFKRKVCNQIKLLSFI